MVEINNNVRRSSICWRGRVGTDNGRQKPEITQDVIVGGELFTDYSDHPRKLVTLNPKLKSSRRRTLPAFSRQDAYRKQFGLKDFSPKVRTLWHCRRRLAMFKRSLPMIDRGDIRSVTGPLQQYLGFTAGRWLWSVRA